jgi:hypothetical protein
MLERRTGRALAVALTVIAGSAGAACGGSHESAAAPRPAAPPGPCTAAVRAAIVGGLGTPAATVVTTAFVSPNGAPGCRFAASRAGAADPVGVQATIDSAPQAEQRFERAVVEYGQNVLWSHGPASAYPLNIAGLGEGADWFPADARLLATDGSRLVEITVTWPAAAARAQRQLAESVARRYLAAR